jgi:hypothetical protein
VQRRGRTLWALVDYELLMPCQPGEATTAGTQTGEGAA